MTMTPRVGSGGVLSKSPISLNSPHLLLLACKSNSHKKFGFLQLDPSSPFCISCTYTLPLIYMFQPFMHWLATQSTFILQSLITLHCTFSFPLLLLLSYIIHPLLISLYSLFSRAIRSTNLQKLSGHSYTTNPKLFTDLFSSALPHATLLFIYPTNTFLCSKVFLFWSCALYHLRPDCLTTGYIMHLPGE